MKNELQGRWALVTGASSGLGADFARELAGRGANLVLVARRESQLEELREEIEGKHGVLVEVIPMDLGTPDAPEKLHRETQKRGRAIDVLVNNAGFGVYGSFLEIPWEREKAMLELDIVSLVGLTKLYAKDMVARSFGYILQVSSIGAFQATPTYASYSAAKAFVLSFGEALRYELKDTGVKVSVLCPGVTATEFLAVSGQKATPYQKMVMMTSPEVARFGVRHLLKGTPSAVPGLVNCAGAFATRLMPRRMSAAVASQLMK